MPSRFFGGVVLLSVFSVGCAGADVRPDDSHLASAAYLYGRFYVDGPGLSFVIRCREGTKYTIDFSSRDEVQMIELPPSICQLDHVVYGGMAQQMAGFRLLRNEILDPGGVYYLGDFRMSGSSRIVSAYPFAITTRFTWQVDNIRDNYAASTGEMRRRFPAFASIPTEDRVSH